MNVDLSRQGKSSGWICCTYVKSTWETSNVHGRERTQHTYVRMYLELRAYRVLAWLYRIVLYCAAWYRCLRCVSEIYKVVGKPWS